jgi:chromosome segregation protein
MKLKKLILSGFKSFADRTELEFDEGISCVVGPNGCGKSNIVDAVKWVLGEQSAKSLRGSEMMDVIFNGSSSRKPAGSAEVTLVFDNTRGLLQLPGSEQPAAAEVSVSRRLFRSGLSEYLINKVPCRLKDIREMFMDTGIGNDAYSLIEQGRVELFLQASQEDRRAVFDEAAGISKYKARKKEAMRKLERVEQNLLRLGDILGEIEKRLRSIKYQAGKARSYQTCSQRLKELRLLHFLAQYHGLSRQRAELQRKLDAGSDALTSLTTRIDQLQASQSATEVEAVDLERLARDLQGQVASVSGQITSGQERAELLTARINELNDQIVAASSRCEQLEAEIESARGDIESRGTELARIESGAAELAAQAEALRAEHACGELAVAQGLARLEDEKAGTIDLLRRTAQLHNEIHGLGIRTENYRSQRSHLAVRAEEIAKSLEAMFVEHAQYEAKLKDVGEVMGASQDRLDQTRQAARQAGDSEQEFRARLATAREQRSAILGRADTLQQMQRRLEGVAAGVRKVLQARAEGKLPVLRGMVGDFLRTDVAHAPLVEAALGGADQQLLADSLHAVQAAREELVAVLGDSGAVEILCLDRVESYRDDFDASCCPQVSGRVIDHVHADPPLAPVLWHLLGKTLIVATLADAAAAAAAAPAGYRFVTPAGDVLEGDGRVRIGSVNRGSGMIVRRSELAELEAQGRRVEAEIEELSQQCQLAHNRREHLEEIQQKLRTAIYEATTERVECESRLRRLNEQIEQLQREKPLVAGDIEKLVRDIDEAVLAEHEASDKARELERLSAERQQEVQNLEEQIASARSHQAELTAKMTELKVALAQLEQRKVAARDALSALTRQLQQKEQDLGSARADIDLNRRRRADAETAVRAARDEVDRLFARQQQLAKEADEAEESRRTLQQRLEDIRRQLTEQRRSHEQAVAEVNALKLELGSADVRIENVIARASEEMSMNLLEASRSYRHDENRDWAAVEAEIAELRGRIERLGNINLDAIAEQDELDARRQFLSTQLQDVRGSQNQLMELIRRINKESREMFLAMFQAVRAHFQELFRKLFGGGRADIMLLDEQDVLESGIEIVARPPGKELRTLSLLSGGEKTMTALALLFSIFKSRPSPFCLLDEVDAALDEANNQRFNRLVQEFVPASQFIIITHAKRTMSMANVLYGVTMPEPGVSRRISVRFEDVGKQLQESLQPA